MMRLTRLSQDSRSITFRLEGWVDASDSGLLESECSPPLTRGLAVRLECSGLTFVGGEGIGVLRRLMARGLELTCCPPIILEIITGSEP